MNASWPNESSPEVKEYTAEEDAQMLREADQLQKQRWSKSKKAVEAIDNSKLEAVAPLKTDRSR
jgi:hypothetical protein